MPTSCDNPQVIDLVAGQLMNQSEAVDNGSPQILDLQTLAITPSDEVTPVATCAEGACGGSSCPFGREIAMLSMLTDVTIGVASIGGPNDNVTALINEAVFTNNEDASPATYTINWGSGPTVPITVGVLVSKDVSILADNVYKGTITETVSGATFEFWYRVGTGAVSARQLTRVTIPTVNISCDAYPEYTIALADAVSVTNAALKINESALEVFTDTVSEETYPVAAYSFSESGIHTTDLEITPVVDTLKAYYDAAVVGAIYNTGIFRTQCILE